VWEGCTLQTLPSSQIHREREAEQEDFGEKEEFITTAYRKKLEEVRKQEELDRIQEAKEGWVGLRGNSTYSCNSPLHPPLARDDVMKKSDLSGFYRNLLTKNVAMGAEERNAPPGKPQATKANHGDTQTERQPEPEPEPEPQAAPAPVGGLDTRRFDERRRREREAEARRAQEERERDSERRRDENRRADDSRRDADFRRPRDDDRHGRERERSPLRQSGSGPAAALSSSSTKPAEPAVSEVRPRTAKSPFTSSNSPFAPKDKLATAFARRATDDSIAAARERYLARKKESGKVAKPTLD
jgi:coiled-coil domain-containing protein 55